LAASCGGQVSTNTSPPIRSCTGAPGAGHDCGLSGTIDCCASAAIPGGSFNRFNDPTFPAAVSPFFLDVFEVTVGRFRTFVNAWPGAWPKPGDGAHPKAPATGWRAEWDHFLPATRDAFVQNLTVNCPAEPSGNPYLTWTNDPGPNERMPAECVSWYEAFAFCAWDGGRLPTLAEWDYVAVGGDEQRKFPWGAAPPDPSRAVLSFTPNGAFVSVGSVPAGATRWGVLDVGGSRSEPVRDGFSDTLTDLENPATCADCIILNNMDDKWFGVRDAYFNGSPVDDANVGELERSGALEGEGRSVALGLRCARDASP